VKEHYRAVVIGGGVVGASVLYHLAKLGWPDVLMVERSELTAGSTWHAAAGFHALNGDPNVAALQDYTIKLYKELEEESGTSLGVHWTGGVNIASTPERWEWLQSAWATFQTVGIESARLVGVDEIRELVPIADLTGVHGGLWDDNEGYLDAVGTTFAYVAAARRRGAEVVLHNRVLELHPRPASAGGGWTVVTEQGTVTCEHVVNAAGLWARQVGRMAGVDLPVTPMEHHYLVTEEVPEVAAFSAAGGRELPMVVDLEGFTYLRQEGKGVLLGVYELSPKHWNLDGVPWDYGVELIPEDLARIEPELMKGFERYPCLNEVGIKKWVNGAFTFTPDGNPLVGPVPGKPGYWVACGVMAGFSQGGGVGLSLAEWMVHGEPSRDVYGMDVARYGRFAGVRPYLKATTGQFYSRRFMMTYPNEQLPAGRPLRTSPLHTRLDVAGARWGVSWGLEVPLYFTADTGFTEAPTLRRSNALDLVAAECRAAREGVALLDTTSFSRYEVRGPGSRDWLDQLLACALPPVGRARLAPMLSPSGRLVGDLTVFCWAEDEYWLMGSYYLRAWHLRWFSERLPPAGVTVRDLSDDVAGVALVGPRSRELLARVTGDDVSAAGLRFLGLAELDAGLARARAGRLSVTGELGFELNLPAGELPGVYDALLAAGLDLGVVPLGYNAVNSLRLEKSFGIWSREFTWAYTPGMSGLDRFVAFDKPDFVGRDAALRERDQAPPAQVLVTLDVAATDSDAVGFEPVWDGDRRVGFVTSGGYGHAIGRSLAMAYVDRALAEPGTALEVHLLGVRRPATVIAPSPVDPTGSRMRA
jgi:dimethylglycine dehydrogenase